MPSALDGTRSADARRDAAIEQIVRWIGELHDSAGRPVVVGIAGAQGSGKSTLATAVASSIPEAQGLSTVVVSLDDFYLTQSERRELARRVHPLLATRGVPGTHDVARCGEFIERLLTGDTVSLPRFDKATDERLPVAQWSRVAGGAEVVLFEGWCVGCPPEPAAALAVPVNALEGEQDADGSWRRFVQSQLQGPYHQLFAGLDALVFLRVPSFEAAFRWRLQQEEELAGRATGHDADRIMDATALRRFMEHYERLTRHMQAVLPSRADVVVYLAEDHRLEKIDIRKLGTKTYSEIQLR